MSVNVIRAECLRCGSAFAGETQDAVATQAGEHSRADHPGLSTRVRFTQPQDTALAAGADAAAAAALVEQENATTLREQLETRLAQLRTARTAITGGTMFASLTNAERQVIDGLLRNDIAIIRLLARKLDATD